MQVRPFDQRKGELRLEHAEHSRADVDVERAVEVALEVEPARLEERTLPVQCAVGIVARRPRGDAVALCEHAGEQSPVGGAWEDFTLLLRLKICDKRVSKSDRIGFGKELDMNRKEIEQAISELSPTELSQFRRWFETYYLMVMDDHHERKLHVDKLRRGSAKGKGLLKALMADKDFEKKY